MRVAGHALPSSGTHYSLSTVTEEGSQSVDATGSLLSPKPARANVQTAPRIQIFPVALPAQTARLQTHPPSQERIRSAGFLPSAAFRIPLCRLNAPSLRGRRPVCLEARRQEASRIRRLARGTQMCRCTPSHQSTRRSSSHHRLNQNSLPRSKRMTC